MIVPGILNPEENQMADDQEPEVENPDEVEDETPEEETDETGEEDKEDGKGDKEEDEEQDLTRVSLGEIKEKYPNLFKDYPTLKHSFFREQEFTQIFPTVEDARKAAEAASAYEEIASAVSEGNAEFFLSELRKENPQGMETFARSFLPALKESSKELYFDTVGPIVKNYLHQVFAHGGNEKDDNIINAARVVHKVLFGGGYDDVEKGEREDIRTNNNGKRDTSIEDDKKRYFAQKYSTLYSGVSEMCYSELDRHIDKGLEDLSKSNKGVAKLIHNEVKQKVLAEMDKDANYLGRINGLWKREQRSGFAGTLKESFRTVFMAKAKTLIPKIRSEVRREAMGKEPANGSNSREASRLTGGKATNSSGKKVTAEIAKEKGLTTRQIFDA